MISLGGALGAVLVAIVAPLVLPGYFELGIALLVLSFVVALRLRRAGPLGRRRGGGGDHGARGPRRVRLHATACA